jgi:hypothetical protein
MNDRNVKQVLFGLVSNRREEGGRAVEYGQKSFMHM